MKLLSFPSHSFTFNLKGTNMVLETLGCVGVNLCTAAGGDLTKCGHTKKKHENREFVDTNWKKRNWIQPLSSYSIAGSDNNAYVVLISFQSHEGENSVCAHFNFRFAVKMCVNISYNSVKLHIYVTKTLAAFITPWDHSWIKAHMSNAF